MASVGSVGSVGSSTAEQLKPANAAVSASNSREDNEAPPPELSPETPLVLVLCCLIAVVCSLDRVLISIAILPMTEQFGYSDSTKGLIAAGFSLGYCLGLGPVSAAASLGSPKTILLGGLLVWSIAQAASPTAAEVSVPALLGARALMGLGEAAAVPSLQAVAARFVPASSRSLFWGCLTASLSCGTLLAYTASPPLIEQYGWAFAFQLFGGAGLAIALLWGALGADSPRTPLPCTAVSSGASSGASSVASGGASSVASGESSNADDELASSKVPWGEIFGSRPVWALAAAHCSTNFFMYFGLSWLPTYFSYQFGMSTADASSASLLPFAAGAVGSLTAGVAGDALVSRGLSLSDSRKVMQSIGCGGPMLTMAALCALSAGVGGVTLNREEAEALFILGVGCQSFSAAGYGCGAQDIATKYSSLIYGSTSVLAVLTGACGQYFTGWLLDQSGRDFTPMFGLVVAVELAGLIAWNSWWSSNRAFD